MKEKNAVPVQTHFISHFLKMVGFGAAEFVYSKFLNKNVLKCRSSAHPDCFYLYKHQKSSDTKFGEKSYYICNGCKKAAGTGTISRVSVTWIDKQKLLGTIQNDPDLNHVSGCEPKTEEEIAGAEMEKEVFVAVRAGKRPSDAHHSVQSSIPKRSKSENLSEPDVIQNFRDRFEMARQLRRHQTFGIPLIEDPWNIPDCYKITHRSKETENPERWFLFQNEALGVLMFCSNKDLWVLANSEIWFADGTFNMCPKEFEQLYFIHVEYMGEPMPIVYCLLKSKKKEVYSEIFRVISYNIQRIVPRGFRIRTAAMMMDFESAERNAFSEVFPAIRVRGCTFHFGQALIRKVTNIGLKVQYADKDSLVRAWIRELLALPFLPSYMIRDVWNGYLNDPRNITDKAGQLFPPTDPQTWQILMDYSQYFVKTWLSRVDDWNHYSNDSHRTNNIPEGFHSKFKRGFGHVHSSLNHVLSYLQELQYEYYCRQMKLEAGGDPRPKSIEYVNLHHSVLNCRRTFDQRLTNLQMAMFRNPPMYRYYFILETKHFLRAMSWLLCTEKKY